MSAGQAGGRATTLYDVARAAGVSTATVSRVVHGHDRVGEETRARVAQVIEELGYVPDGAAQSLSRRRKQIIGLVAVERLAPESDVESMSLLFVDEILRGVEAVLRDRGWSLLISFLRADEPHPHHRLRVISGQVDGLLIVEGIVSPPHLARLNERIPVVLVAGGAEEKTTDVVVADNQAGAGAAVEHLIETHGCHRLFFVGGPPSAPDAVERKAAFEQVVRRHPLATAMGTVEGMFSARSGELAARAILSARAVDGLPDAVVCANDQMAIGVIRAFEDAGVAVPREVAVVGFDDIYPAALWLPPLTTVRQPMRALGERAASRLLDRIADPTLVQRVEILPTNLVVRASCGCAPPPEPAAAAQAEPELVPAARSVPAASVAATGGR